MREKHYGKLETPYDGGKMNYFGIYKITNLVNGKMYIGKHITDDIDDGYMGSGTIIKRAVKKYGQESFHKEWLMFCEDEAELDYMERVFVDQTWIDRSDTYNLKLGGEGGWGYINKNRLNQTPEAIKKNACRRTGMKMSDEARRNMSEAKRNMPNREDWKRKLAAANLGKKHSDETRRKMSLTRKGRKCSEEAKRNMSLAQKGHPPYCLGKKHSEETKRKMAEARKRYWEKRRKNKDGLEAH